MLAVGMPVDEYRALKDISQEALADRLGVSQATISRWENKDVRIVDNGSGRLRAFEVRQVAGPAVASKR